MSRRPTTTIRLGVVGAIAILAGSTLLVSVAVQMLGAPAYADTGPFELFCTGSPIGNLALNDTAIAGSISTAAPMAGSTFSLDGLQVQEQIPASVLQAASAIGASTITGTVSGTIDATGATPASMPLMEPFTFDVPSTVPASGVTLSVPTTPTTVGPFTATASQVSLSLASSVTLSVNLSVEQFTLPCGAYPNDVITPSGTTGQIPPGLPESPLIAVSPPGSSPPTTSPASATTGPYELYCPHTPVGDLVFNDVVTTGTIPSGLSAGQSFSVTGYQTQLPVPPGVVSAATGLDNDQFNGVAAAAVDAYGATPQTVATGSMGFDVPIPSPLPTSALAVDIPATPTTVGPFQATGGPITIAEDQAMQVVVELSGKAFTMACTAYPNDDVSTSGSVTTAPTGAPIRPVLAVSTASGSLPTTTTAPVTPFPQTVTGPYELYCPQTPVGDIVLNDTSTTATIPSGLQQGDTFSLGGLQTQFSIPQSVAEQMEGLGFTTLSGDLSMFVDATGAEFEGNPGIPVPTPPESTPPGTVVFNGAAPTQSTDTTATTGPGSVPPGEPITTSPPGVPITTLPPEPGPIFFPGELDMAFSVTLPNPVPASGVQFTATPPSGEPGGEFVAAGGPIEVTGDSFNLNVSAFGDQFGLFCTPYPNDTEPTGLTTQAPDASVVEPVIATGSATSIPVPPVPPGGPNPYELYCPGTPVGNIVLNGVSTIGTMSPSDPTPGQEFELDGYQSVVPLPNSIASAAAALGNIDITGSGDTTIDASGATPASTPEGPLNFTVPLPQPIPSTGVTFAVPATGATVGPFTATSSTVTLSEDSSVSLSLLISGSDLNLECTSYPNDSAPSGIVVSAPTVAPITPVIATNSSTTPTTTPSGPGTTVVTTEPGGTTPTSEPVPVTDTTTADPTSGTATTTAGMTAASSTSMASTTQPPTGAATGSSTTKPGPATASAQSTGAPRATSAPAGSGTVSASSGSLAFTGPGAGVGWTLLAGAALIAFGMALLVLVDTPRRLAVAIAVRSHARRRSPHLTPGDPPLPPPPSASALQLWVRRKPPAAPR